MATMDILATKILSPTLSLLATGYGICASHNVLPYLYNLPASTSTPIFAHVFRVGGSIVVPSCLFSTACSAYLAYQIPSQKHLWLTAAASALASLPWTRLVMYPGIMRLIAISENGAEAEKCEQTKEHVRLLRTWTFQNYIRSFMFLTAGLAGFWAVSGRLAGCGMLLRWRRVVASTGYVRFTNVHPIVASHPV